MTVTGFKIRTDMQHTSVDCPKLWMEKFGPIMCSLPADPAYPGQSYGLSTNADTATGAFDYWATMPLAPDAEIPAGMESVILPAGEYLVCDLETLADIGPAFGAVYEEWLPSQTDYKLDMLAPFFELYGPQYLKNGRLSIGCRLIRQN